MKSKLDPMVFAVVYAAVVPLALAAIANWQSMPALVKALSGQTAAAWAQAFGSFAALGLAYYLGGRQHRVERERREAERVEFLNSLRMLAAYTMQVAQTERAQMLSGPGYYAAGRGDLTPYEDLAASFEAVDQHRIGNAQGILAVRQLTRACRRAKLHMQRVIEEFDDINGLDSDTRQAIGDWVSGIESARLMLARVR